MRRDWRSVVLPSARWARESILRALRGPRRIGWVDRTLGETADYLLDCRKVRSELSNAHDEQLSPLQAKLVRAHLSTCVLCSSVDTSMRTTISLLHELRDQD